MHKRRHIPKLPAKDEREDGDIEQQADDRDGSEVLEEFEKCEMRGDADESILRVAGDGHDRADVGGGGQREEIRELGEIQAVCGDENDGSEHEAHSVVDEKRGENAGGENEQDEELKRSLGDAGDAKRDPVEEMRNLKMRDENHDAEEENDGVPTDGAIGGVERDDAREDHGDGAAECGGGAVEMAAAAGFDGDENVGDEENADGEPVKMGGSGIESEKRCCHAGREISVLRGS